MTPQNYIRKKHDNPSNLIQGEGKSGFLMMLIERLPCGENHHQISSKYVVYFPI